MTFLWPEISGYMAACWRALADEPGWQVSIIAIEPSDAVNTKFSSEAVRSLDVVFLKRSRIEDRAAVIQELDAIASDVVVVSGWWNPAYTAAASVLHERGTPIVLAMDTPFRSTPVALARRALSRRLFRYVDAVVMPGERGMRLADALGFPSESTHPGLYGVDRARLAPALTARRKGTWPRRFLFLGQLTPTKGFDILIEGYRRYRQDAAEPWPLTVCGAGPLQHLAEATPGVDYRGFVDPADHCELLAEHGVLVLPSRFDPWPLAIVEAATAGLPVLCSTSCGSAVELIRDRFNGRVMPLRDGASIAAGLQWLHDRADELPDMGARSSHLAEPYSAEMWSKRWVDYLRGVVAGRSDQLAKPPR